MGTCSTYHEVDVPRGHTFEAVDVPFKWGADPLLLFDVRHLPAGVRFSSRESDPFFAELPEHVQFESGFLDGLHEWSHTYSDLLNALRHSHPHSIIVIDDVVPSDEYSSIPDEQEALFARSAAGLPGLPWHGDVYKTLLEVSDYHPELDFRVIYDPAGNSQAVLLRVAPTGYGSMSERIAERFEAYSHVSCSDIFADGVQPRTFRFTDGRGAIESAVRGRPTVGSTGPTRW
jgi:hypothetical protein